MLNAVLGNALGLLASAFSSTEFQAVQLMPAFLLTQILLCGMRAPRDTNATGLRWLSDVLPITSPTTASPASRSRPTSPGGSSAISP